VKGISTVLALILIIIIIVALVGLTYTFAIMLFNTAGPICNSMALSLAKQLTTDSECGEKGVLEGTYACNEDTHTWWMDLDIYDEVWDEVEGSEDLCDPACVIDTETGNAEINWRCLGVTE